ncbi:MAG: radical SAM protein [Myxococcaceae bacterium]
MKLRKILFVYPRFQRHAEAHPELKQWVPMNEYLGSPSLGIATMAAVTPDDVQVEFRDDRLTPADRPTDADVVCFSFFTPAATRAFELAAYFRAQGKTLICGGIFPTMMPEECAPHFDAVVMGEGEPVWPQVLADLRAGKLQPRYKAATPQALNGLPLPRVDLYLDKEEGAFQPDDYPVQLTRGCPLNCAACVLPVSMTTSMREFELDHVVGQLEQLARRGKRACLTEDTSWFPGSAVKGLKALFERIVARGAPATISYVGISMPMILASSNETLKLAKRAGVDMFYLVGGFDPVTKGAFTKDNPKQLQRAYDAIKKSLDAGIVPYTSFLLGNEDDDLGTVDRMLEFASRSGITKAEFAIFTPYPGTPSWKKLVAEDRIIDRTWARYNDANCVFLPKHFTPQQLTEGYLRLWREFYAGKSFAHTTQAERTIQF